MTDELLALLTLVPRHGAAVVMVSGEEIGALFVERTLTKRGARKAYDGLQRRMFTMGTVDEYPPGTTLLAARFERGRVVERLRVPLPGGGDEPDAGVREPRRPHPPEHGASATA